MQLCTIIAIDESMFSEVFSEVTSVGVERVQASIIELLKGRGKSSELALSGRPAVVFIVGVNGAGKTTTIGKLASKFGGEGAKVQGVDSSTDRPRLRGGLDPGITIVGK